MKKYLLIGSLLFIGCVGNNQPQPIIIQNPTPPKNTQTQTSNSPAITNINKKYEGCFIDNRHKVPQCILRIEAKGVGVAPCNGACSMAQAKVMARRAAIVDAYKALVEKIYGIKIYGRDTIKNMILKNSTLRAYLEGLIRGAIIEDEEFKDGIYSVIVSIKLDAREWNRFLLKNY